MLYIVATPIGNLSDITFRAVEILKSVDLIACEDTRRTKILLEHYQISKPLVSYHQHSKIQKVDFLINELKDGKDIALVSDAGTPGISDPGGKLVEAAIAADIKVSPIAGACAIAAALSVAGIPTDNFVFLGFLPHKKGRQTLFKKIENEKMPVVFYESVHRIEKTLEQLKEYIGERKIIVCRELTKKFENIYRGTVEEVLEQLRADRVLGEFVVIVSDKQ